MPTAHGGFLDVDQDAAFAAAADIGVQTLIQPFVDPARWQDPAEVAAIAASLNEAAVTAAGYGLRVGYHNHHFEFESKFDGRHALEVLADQLNPAVVLEVDTYWAYAGGADVPALLARLGDRVVALHVKDGDGSLNTKAQTAVGSGTLPVLDIIAAAPHALRVVELDDSEATGCRPSRTVGPTCWRRARPPWRPEPDEGPAAGASSGSARIKGRRASSGFVRLSPQGASEGCRVRVPVGRQRRLSLERALDRDEGRGPDRLLDADHGVEHVVGQLAGGPCGWPSRTARAISSTPVPREDSSAGPVSTSGCSWCGRCSTRSPWKRLGSGNVAVPSDPFTSITVRPRAESKEKIITANWPDR